MQILGQAQDPTNLTSWRHSRSGVHVCWESVLVAAHGVESMSSTSSRARIGTSSNTNNNKFYYTIIITTSSICSSTTHKQISYCWKATIRGFPTHRCGGMEAITAHSYGRTILILSYPNLSPGKTLKHGGTITLTVDGRPQRVHSLRSWKQVVGFVPQEDIMHRWEVFNRVRYYVVLMPLES